MHSVVAELLDAVDSVLRDRSAAREVARAIVSRWGGGQVYIPRSPALGTDAEILAAFDGSNHRAVCARFSITRDALYRRLRENK